VISPSATFNSASKDTTVPPRLSECAPAPIAAEPGRDSTVVDLPRANHALVETRTGLTSELLRSDTYAPGLVGAVGAWLRGHHPAASLR
jgi:hypothetical protein